MPRRCACPAATRADERHRRRGEGTSDPDESKHYSEMIGLEQAPSDAPAPLRPALLQNGARMASEVQSLALALNAACTGPGIALVSFVRAGLPLGVLLRRALVEMGRDARHYGSASFAIAGSTRLRWKPSSGCMAPKTSSSSTAGPAKVPFPASRTDPGGRHALPAGPRLVVLADPCGRAWLAASAQDWTIPSGIPVQPFPGWCPLHLAGSRRPAWLRGLRTPARTRCHARVHRQDRRRTSGAGRRPTCRSMDQRSATDAPGVRGRRGVRAGNPLRHRQPEPRETGYRRGNPSGPAPCRIACWYVTAMTATSSCCCISPNARA